MSAIAMSAAAPQSGAPTDDEEGARKKRILNVIRGSVFLSVCQHCITTQPEPMLVRQLLGGDTGRAQAGFGFVHL